MIIGRDHAGVGDFYGMFEAQTIFDKIPTPEGGKGLLCQPLKIDWTFYCYKCDGMASLRTCPHGKEDRVLLSGTMLRKMLSEGGDLPDHFGRDEVVEILRKYYGQRPLRRNLHHRPGLPSLAGREIHLTPFFRTRKIGSRIASDPTKKRPTIQKLVWSVFFARKW